MHPKLYLFLDALYLLAKQKQNGDQDFLLKLAHAIVSYQLAGIAFLIKNKNEATPAFMLTELLPLVERLGLGYEAKHELLLAIAARLLDAQRLQGEIQDPTVWDDINLPKVIGNKLLQEVEAASI